ncbi:MAG: homocysteine S-methyltransferase family protein [Actinomycetia bacterium]|nr:homocysteine S-methyltransferase family protein [Actinomycetes bacterium]MCP4223654.1 homocysteine S-methyltransferase family protein [Actinomycetes bacterium]MCP5034988.1 homocysteine S-methyltransferase family protein [Actinomycetes bacterium]
MRQGWEWVPRSDSSSTTRRRGATQSSTSWRSGIGLIQANASRCSHEELDNAPELDPGDPVELGVEIAAPRNQLPGLAVVGGCCGTSHAHIDQMAQACDRVPVEG